MQNEIHTHNFVGKTSFNVEHSHSYSGVTSGNPDQPGHFHYMEGLTSLNDGHIHNYQIATGPAIYVKDGHYHYYNGNTNIAFIPTTHAHNMTGYTSLFMG